MMNSVSRCSERTPDVLVSTAAESPGKTRHESQLPLSSWNEQQPRTGRLVMGASSSYYSEWNIDEKWSPQQWKSDELMEERTGRLVNEQPPGLFTEDTDKFMVDDNDMDSDTDAESEMSFLSRSFLHKLNHRVPKIQDQSSKDAQHKTSTFFKMANVLEASVLMGKNYSEILHSMKKKKQEKISQQMFDISEKLITEQSDEIY